MGPVLLFHPGVVVFAIRARAGEADRGGPLAEVSEQMPVEELVSVIGIEAQDGERQLCFDLGDARGHRGLASVRHGASLGPLGMDIGHGEAPAKLSRHALAAVGHGVGFEEAGAAHLPVLGPDRNLAAQERAGPGPATAAIRAVPGPGVCRTAAPPSARWP